MGFRIFFFAKKREKVDKARNIFSIFVVRSTVVYVKFVQKTVDEKKNNRLKRLLSDASACGVVPRKLVS